MIDTLRIYTQEFTVKDDSDIILRPSPYLPSTGELLADYPLYSRDDGAMITGSKAYFYNDRMNLSINARGAIVQFSIPKVAHNGDNFYPASKSEAVKAIDQVQGDLWQAGFHSELMKGEINRIDSFVNVQADETFDSYAPILTLCRGKRKFLRDYGSTILWGNKQEQLTTYDKIEEMKRRKHTGNYPMNTLRFEHRLLNKRKAGKKLGFIKVEEIADNWDVVKKVHNAAFANEVFADDVAGFEILTGEQVARELMQFRIKFGKRYIDQYWKHYGVLAFSRKVSKETIRMAIEYVEQDSSYDARRMKVKRTINRMEAMKKQVMFFRKDEQSKKTWGNLYLELKEKVLA